MSARTEIAAAVDAVEGVSCSPYFNNNLGVGNAFVRLGRTFLGDDRFGYLDSWSVVVVLPQGIADAEKKAEAFTPLILDALMPEDGPRVLLVASIDPESIALPDGGSMPALVFSGTRENTDLAA